MGLFDKVAKVASGKLEKEGLDALREILNELRELGLLGLEREGAQKALRLVVRALKNKGVASPETVEEAEKMIRALDGGIEP